MRFVLCFFLIVPLSCQDSKLECSNSCCGETFEIGYTEIDSLLIDVGSIEVYQGNGYQRNDFKTTKSSSFEDAAIMIEVSALNRIASVPDNSKPNSSFLLINHAHACSPREPEPIQKITSISVYSDQPVTLENTTYAAGDDLSDFFSVVNLFSDQKDTRIEDFIFEQNKFPLLFGSFDNPLLLRLSTAIQLPKQTITVRLAFDDGSVFSLSTNEFIIE